MTAACSETDPTFISAHSAGFSQKPPETERALHAGIRETAEEVYWTWTSDHWHTDRDNRLQFLDDLREDFISRYH